MQVQLEEGLLSGVSRRLAIESDQTQRLDQPGIVEAEEILEALPVSITLNVVPVYGVHL